MKIRRIGKAILAVALLVTAAGTKAPAADDLLRLESKISLGRVAGRIDHFAFDFKRNRLFVAELGNNSVSVLDLATQKVVKRIAGLHEPQGIAYEPAADRVYIANAADGVVAIFSAEDLSRIGQLKLGEDADNIRIMGPKRILVGYGNGAIAILQAGEKVLDLPLAAHPESFQLDKEGSRLFVNEPDAHAIGVIDLKAGHQLANWNVAGLEANFPMALDITNHHLFVVYRSPATLVAFDITNGKVLDRMASCGDADDVFFDAKRSRVYLSCGEGVVAVVDASNGKLAELGRLATRPGARTSLWVPELDRFFVAIRAKENQSAEVWVFRPH